MRIYLRARVFRRLRCNRRTRFFFLVLLVIEWLLLLPFGSHLRLFDFGEDESVREVGGDTDVARIKSSHLALNPKKLEVDWGDWLGVDVLNFNNLQIGITGCPCRNNVQFMVLINVDIAKFN